MSEWVESIPGGIRILLRIQPKASSARVVGPHGGRLKVAVTAAPEKGKANAAVLKLLCRELGVSLQRIELVAGDTHRDKIVEVSGITLDAIPASWTSGG